MSKIKYLIASVLLAGALPVHAEFVDGNLLLSRILGSEADEIHALGYITGVADATINKMWCPKGDLTSANVLAITKATLIASPKKRDLSGDVFVVAALMRALPCAPKAPPPGSKSL